MSWAALFDRAAEFDATEEAIREARPTEYAAADPEASGEVAADTEASEDAAADAVRVVADADVLAADLLVGDTAREALDIVRRHSWVELVASDELLGEAHATIAAVATPDLADDWLDRVSRERVRTEHPPDDHPALASAYRGEAPHLLTTDGELTSTGANVGLQQHMRVSVREPAAFVTLFDAESLYEGLFEASYPGPDRDPRA